MKYTKEQVIAAIEIALYNQKQQLETEIKKTSELAKDALFRKEIGEDNPITRSADSLMYYYRSISHFQKNRCSIDPNKAIIQMEEEYDLKQH